MNTTLKASESLDEKVTLTLTQRDLLLLKLCLKLVLRNHARSGSLQFEIETLRDKLSR